MSYLLFLELILFESQEMVRHSEDEEESKEELFDEEESEKEESDVASQQLSDIQSLKEMISEVRFGSPPNVLVPIQTQVELLFKK